MRNAPGPVLLSALASSLAASHRAIVSGGDAEILDIQYDSRDILPGALFLAVVGEKFDGHAFLAQALESGAAAAVVQADRAELHPLAVPSLIVNDVRRAMPFLADQFFGRPSRALKTTGVTGTNGKTTTALLIDSIARATGAVTGTIGTLGATVAGRALPGDRTTPESPDLQRLLFQMVDAGASFATMEVASHALALGRTDSVAFDVAVFTNLTQDHLDYHGTMENYRDAKGILFTDYADAAKSMGKAMTAVLNIDDAAGRHYREITRAERKLTYSPSGSAGADIIAENVALAVDSISFVAKTPIGNIEIRLGFGGTFQVANALAAVGAGIALGASAEQIAVGLASSEPVNGRFHPVKAGQDFAVLIDYAHTPDGVENVLKAARPLTSGRLIVVFGCGGNRDRTKRPIMGRLAKALADIAIATSDNPRKENPEAILDDILAGMDQSGGADVLREVDRRLAIRAAVRMARAGDTIVIAGKGHEDYQIVGEKTLPFSDRAVAEEEIASCL